MSSLTGIPEIVHYAKLISETWYEILGENKNRMEITDEATVEAVQLRAPCLTEYDAGFVRKQMAAGKLFPAVRDTPTR